ncbi:MAG TPA: phosphotransferase [Terriglobia bacterium]|nr:phosphotransferase [Terriglobia bacterium]
MNAAFAQASYLAQVRRLRALAQQALPLYARRVEACRFLGHGENTTFQVTADGGKQFLLRIHRNEYHSRSALVEELRWLQELSDDPMLIVPRPIPSKRGQLVERVESPGVGEARHCSALEWIDGRFINKSLNRSHMKSLGHVIGRLHKVGRHRTVVERPYWNAEGLVGTNAKLGTVENLPKISSSDQRTISDGRRITFRKLKRFEDRFPQRQGMIHADLHFGNLLLSQGQIAAIDFDDCGFGFHGYDLVVPLRSAEHILGKRRRREFPAFKDELIEGYCREAAWDKHDDEIFPHLISARALTMLAWFNSRWDNPALRKYFKLVASRTVEHLRSLGW